jgi:long-chain acyl-CoA synthetase
MEITRTFDILHLQQEKYKKEDALAGKEQGVWVKYSSEQYVDIATHLALGLLAHGLNKGQIVATISNSRPEWNFMDMAITQAGLVHLPIYPTISAEEYEYILNHAEPVMVVVSDQALYDKINPICQKIGSVKDVFTYNEIEGKKNWKELLELGRQNADRFRNKLEEIKASIKPGDLVTLIYTSGTTGFPKGVMLSHDNLLSNVRDTITGSFLSCR